MFAKYPVTCALLKSLMPTIDSIGSDDTSLLSDWLKLHWKENNLPEFIPGLAGLEEQIAALKASPAIFPTPDRTITNPSLVIVQSDWINLPAYLSGEDVIVTAGEEFVLIWQAPDGNIHCKSGTDQDLLALKLIAEDKDLEKTALDHGVTVGMLDAVIRFGEKEGFLLAPGSLISRPPDIFSPNAFAGEKFLTSPVFTLQWHITQACDLHCRHCYDRSNRKSVPLDMGIKILDDFRSFCKIHHVSGQIYFTGGNPLLHDHFFVLYQAAADRGFQLAVLGNPAEYEIIRKIQSIKPPAFYQVSLEGLEHHNDEMRGKGHFKRTLTFLDILKSEGIFSTVMLTLTRDNQNQVMDLAEFLRDKVDLFTFNRLAMVGNGASLMPALPERYASFLQDYYNASLENPCMGLKDNLFNSLFYQKRANAFGGCTGYGCGAAFNFVSVLPDGEVHACRKLPSLIGNLYDQRLIDVYYDTAARKYRSGSEACKGCPTRNVCGGCLAVAHGMGLDIFTEKDPYCFLTPQNTSI